MARRSTAEIGARAIYDHLRRHVKDPELKALLVEHNETGNRVELRYDPEALDELEVWHDGRFRERVRELEIEAGDILLLYGPEERLPEATSSPIAAPDVASGAQNAELLVERSTSDLHKMPSSKS